MNAGARAKLIAIGALMTAAIVPTGANAGVKDAFGPAADVTVHPETGKATFVATEPGRALPAPTKGSPEAVAQAFLFDHARPLGLRGSELNVARVEEARGGRTSVRLDQVVHGAKVIGGELIVNLDSAGEVLSVSGETSPAPDVASEPGISPEEAAETAIAATAKHSDVDAADLEASKPELSILDSRLIDGPDLGPTALVYRTDVTSPVHADINDYVAIEAESGAIMLKFSQIAHALDRFHCDAGNTATRVPCTAPFARTETSGPSTISDVNDAFDFTGDTYDFFFNRFGRDSLDGSGLDLLSTTRFCEAGFDCPYANAFWNGEQMVYGQGLESDDVVGHELGHGLMDYTAGLLYYYQSGAINESLSDVWGELIDQTNGAGTDTPADRWKLGEDISENHFVGTCSTGPELRNMQDPTLCGLPDRMQSPLYWGEEGDSGGVHINSGVNNKAAYLMTDGGSFNGQTVSALGINKVAAIYYDVQTTKITSGADFANLASGLRQSCAELTGSGGITAANCAELNKALLATEMDQTPTAAPNPEAPVCTGQDTPTNFFNDDMESGTGWTFTGDWDYTEGYATSGVLSLYTPNPDVTSAGTATSPNINVPATVPPGGTYLHFKHAYGTEASYDGGRVEYSTNGGTSWQDAGSLLTHGQYNGSLFDSGQDAFTGVSNGYISSRINLASLAGQTVKLRFSFSSDSAIGYFPGWVVDDVRAYTCGAGAANNPPVLGSIGNKNATVGNQLSFQVSATDADGDALTYSASNLPSGANFNPATRTFTWTPTQAGTHPNVHFEVTDGTATDSENITITVTGGGDTDPPETTILAGPAKDTIRLKKGKRRAKVVYDYGSDENPVTFQCNINSSGWQNCFASTLYTLPKGKWTLEARAVDAAGNVDPTPVSDTITVKKKKRRR